MYISKEKTNKLVKSTLYACQSLGFLTYLKKNKP